MQKSKKLLSIILSILMVVTMIPMAVMPASAATEATDLYSGTMTAYSAGVTQYLEYNNYLYKVTYTNLKLEEVGLGYSGYDSLKLYTSSSSYINPLTSYRGKTAKLSDLPTSPGSSIAFYTSMYVSNEKNPVVTFTCMAVSEPVWTWNGTSSATAVFTSTDGSATMTVNATIESSTQTVANCLEKDKITYTATATANGQAYTNEKTTYGEAGNHTGGTATCTAKAVCEVCGSEYGSLASDNHDWSNKDGVCAKGCGETCAHESYTDDVCDNCEYACPHEWGEGTLTRPIRVTTTDWDDGYYTYTCSICGHYYHEAVKRADYSAFEAVMDDYIDIVNDSSVLDGVKDELDDIYNQNIDIAFGDRIESEQAEVNAFVKLLAEKIDEIKAEIEDGTAVKADYTEIDEAIASVDTALENATISKEMAAELADIKADLEALKADANTSAADLVNSGLLARAEAIAETMADCANGVHSFTTYEEVTAPECGKAGLEKATCDNGCGATDEKEIPALAHSFTTYEEVTAPECGKAGLEKATCDNGCGETDEKEIPALAHSFTKYEEVTAPECGKAGLEKAICDNGCGATDEKEIAALTHKDDDGDFLCDYGCGHEFEKPAVPDTPDTPDKPTDDTCDHLCHKSGFMGFIWKIVRFFQNLFGIQQYCDCGVTHW